ncbi:uncharacterized protein GGS22DRAFT_199621 [Annulohypoxylon maeteangense]|uniref:uncharacterized protein n=1 Tax=Annulohypoxylon maeteangense TaxID=1927788 RepID=UPI0020084E44|nr:uncharacterized protein GGS22DRAFT_199621 [Annulohypoxylon maeteangense]KAI0886342.1 hypothetical protein GGS22DRAFT_199621 [Annulohypoxylon maeteangense]
MPSLTTTLTTLTLLTLTIATTTPQNRANKNIIINNSNNNCPGVTFVHTNSQGCCVGGSVDQPYLSVCKGWPVCQGPTTTTWVATPISCATIVTDGPDYDKQIESARESLSKSGTRLVTPLDGGVTQTGTATATAETGQSGSGVATETGSAGGSTTTGAAAAAATSEGVAAGLVVGMGGARGAVLGLLAALL